MRVRLAIAQDAPAINALILDYYARRNAPPQYRKIGTWYVGLDDLGVVHAAQNWEDGAPGERWLLDTYSFNTREGYAALSAIVKHSHERADADGVALLGVSEMDNLRVGEFLNGRGWVDVGILRRREPGAKRLRKVG